MGAIALGLVTGVAIFISCNKEENTEGNVSETNSNNGIQIRKLDELGVTVVRGKGCGGKGKDKKCCGTTGCCWLWFDAVPSDPFDDILLGGGIFAVLSVNDDEGEEGDDSNDGDNHRNIILDFKYKYNTEAALNDFFDLTDYLFVIEEDIVEEEGSYLLDFIGTTLPCTIPAGEYSITVSTGADGGIIVILPVIIE